MAEYNSYFEKLLNVSLEKKTPPTIVDEELISPVELGESLKVETYIEKEVKKEVKKNNKRYIGEVAELPAAVDYEEGTLVRKGKTVFIKQDGIWESLIEGNTVTREVIKYGVPGGGCGVDEVKRIIKSEGVQEFASFAELQASGYTAQGPGSKAMYLENGAWRDATYTTLGWLPELGFISEDTLLVIGDSYTAYDATYAKNSNNSYNVNGAPFGPDVWTQFLLGDGAFSRTHFRGYPGISAWAILNGTTAGWNVPAIAASSNAKYVQLNLGTNDIDQGRTAQQCSADVLAIADSLAAQGRIVVLRLIQPRASGYSGWNSDKQKMQIAANSLIAQYAMGRGYTVIDGSKAFTDFTSAEYVAKTGATFDGIHAASKGAYLIGKESSAVWSRVRPKKSASFPIIHKLNTSTNDQTSTQLLPNPLFSGATYWTIAPSAYGAVTPSFVAAPSGEGSAIVIDVDTLASAADRVALLSSAWVETAECWVPGKALVFRAHIKIEGFGGSGNPVGVLSPWATVYTTQYSDAWGQSATLLASNAYLGEISEAFEGVLQPYPQRFTGKELNKRKEVAIGVCAAKNARFRVTIWGASVTVVDDDYATYPLLWTPTAPPGAPEIVA